MELSFGIVKHWIAFVILFLSRADKMTEISLFNNWRAVSNPKPR